MPLHEEHCRHSEQRYGVRGDDIHTWMDEPSLIMGYSHREERHNPVRDAPMIIRIFGAEYGDDLAKQIFLDHIYLDTKERANRIQDYPESSRPFPDSGPSDFFPSGNTLIETIGAIAFGLIVLYALNTAFNNPIGLWWSKSVVNPIGLWWSQNWFIVVGIILALPILLIVVYTFRNKNRVAKVLWNLIY